MIFDELPSEVLAVIGSYCGQADLVSLSIACPKISDAILPGVYQCIVIDPIPRAMYDNRALKSVYVNGTEVLMPMSTVHTIAGLKQLFDTLGTREQFASMVRSFTVKGNLAISDIALIPRLRKVFKNLTRVCEFEWTACPELAPDLLAELPHDDNGINQEIKTLCVDLATRPGQEYPVIRLPNLQRIHVRPFLNAQVLSWLRTVVLDSADIEDIKLYRFLDTKSEVGSSFAFVGLSDVHQQHDPCPAVSVFFRDSTKRHRLRCLDLCQIDTSEQDVLHLEKSVDLSLLKELKLMGSGREDEFNHGILSCIVRARPQLYRADIDWNASYLATHAFLTKCCQSVRVLKLNIKEFPYRILTCLQKNCSAATYVDIQMQCDFSMADLKPISELKNIEVLKLPFNHTVNSWEVSLSLPKLKMMELTWKTPSGSSSYSNDNSMRSQGRLVNMGLLTSGILDQWNDTYRSPLQCANVLESVRNNRSLNYVVIDGHVTALKTSIPSLETYEY